MPFKNDKQRRAAFARKVNRSEPAKTPLAKARKPLDHFELSAQLHEAWAKVPNSPELRNYLRNNSTGAALDEAADDAADRSLSFGDYLTDAQMREALDSLQDYMAYKAG